MAPEQPGAAAPDPTEPVRIVTHRPGGGAPTTAILGVLGLLALMWVSPRFDGSRSMWDEGAPVLVEVGGRLDDGSIELVEYGTTRSWQFDADDVARAASSLPGTQIQGRLVGECRCQLMLLPGESLPWYLPLIPLAFVVGSLPGLIARRRWHRLGAVLASPPRTVTVGPVWIRRPQGPAAWGVRAAGEGHPDLYLELGGTPPTWLPEPGTRVALHGPDPANGLTVLGSESGWAVASSAPRTGEAGAKRVPAWSSDLAVVADMIPPPAEAPLQVGGAGHQRIRVPSEPTGVEQTRGGLQYLPARVFRPGLLLVGMSYVLWLALVIVVRPPFGWMLVAYVVVIVASRSSRSLFTKQLASVPPLQQWPDRAAAREAAAAAATMGLSAERRGAKGE